MELDDLPPRYREQAIRQIQRKTARRVKCDAGPGQDAVKERCESRGEWDFYIANILPRLRDGKIRRFEQQKTFELLPGRRYGTLQLPAAHYTPDFVIEWADGVVEVVEIKCRFTQKSQRDYIYRRRLFIDLVAEPRGWKFTEIITDKEEKQK